jgi:VIT1/CCC1 family predicted Fe2+/Mn2+ transporter
MPLGAHARDELGISEALTARAVHAALALAASVTAGAALPLAVVALAPALLMSGVVAASSLVFLAGIGALAMALTADVRALFGAVVG